MVGRCVLIVEEGLVSLSHFLSIVSRRLGMELFLVGRWRIVSHLGAGFLLPFLWLGQGDLLRLLRLSL